MLLPFLYFKKLNYIDHIEYTIVLRPQGFFQRIASDKTVAAICNDVSFPLHVIDEPNELFEYISSMQIPRQFGGDLFFNVSSWADFQIVSGYHSIKLKSLSFTF